MKHIRLHALFLPVCLLAAALPSAAQSSEPAVVSTVKEVAGKVGQAVERGVKAAASGVERGAQAAARGVKTGVHAAAQGVEKGAQATARAAEAVASKVKP
jgi:phage-related protein